MKIGIIADIHEDVASLTEVLRILGHQGCEMLVCLGDILGFDGQHYGFGHAADGDECIRLVRENCAVAVAGNHDLFAIRKVPCFTAGFSYDNDWYTRKRIDRLALGKGRLWSYCEREESRLLKDESLDFLDQLPEFHTLNHDGMTIHCAHFLYPDLSGSTTRLPRWVPDLWPHLSWMKKQECTTGFSGHAHMEKMLTGSWYSLHGSDKPVHTLTRARSWFTCPPVVSGNVRSGFLILDTVLQTINLHFIG